ncbi:MAG: SIS domain-containing protein [Propionicimonas sp.]
MNNISLPQWAISQVSAHRDAAEAVLDHALESVLVVAEAVRQAYEAGGVLYSFGNGGSAADAQHLTGELIGHYKRDRRPLPAVTLTTDATVVSCVANDYSYDDVFSRQVEALARPQDVVVGFSTSGRSPSVIAGLQAAQRVGATTVLFGGAVGGPAASYADHQLLAPASGTARAQEVHTLMLHLISEYLDAWAAGEEPTA